MAESETKDKSKSKGFQIDSLLLDSVSTLETMKDIKDKIRSNRYSDFDSKLLTMYSKALYLHILNNIDDIYKMM